MRGDRFPIVVCVTKGCRWEGMPHEMRDGNASCSACGETVAMLREYGRP